ncbi:MAG: hypothetical protein ACYS8K_08535, partial [Planctomycetota bacterium]
MKVSAAVDLVWQLAGQQAIAGEFKEIGPEHFLMALLKLAELPVEDVDRIAPGAQAARDLAAEVRVVSQELARRGIDSTRVRRELRARLGRGGSAHDGGAMHRAPASRRLFERAAGAADAAGSETTMTRHLLDAILESPTDLMVQILGESAGPRAAVPETPLLAEHGRDMARLAGEGKLPATAGREAESKALLGALSRADRGAVLLVSESDEAVRETVCAVARVIGADAPPPSL